MKLIARLFLFVIFISLFLTGCESDKSKSKNEAPKPKDRNIGGFGIKRGLTKTTDGLADGYILYAVYASPLVYLLNRKGEVMHQWKSNYGAMNAYLQDDGSVFIGVMDPDFPTFGGGGPTGRIQKINWDGKMLLDFELANEKEMLHHDFTIMPNGHILALAYEVLPYETAIAKGRKPEKAHTDGPWFEKVVELEIVDKHHAEVVWEWHLWDHVIQDFDKTKNNFGNPSEHPELIDINLGNTPPPLISEDSLEILRKKGRASDNTTVGNRNADVFHINAIKYNPQLDQIVLSSPNINEIFIIDHNTTTKEASAHKGGKSGKGGDLLYRWGNPKNYYRGDSTNQQLGGQHDARWVETGFPGEGNLTIFNNNFPPSGPDSTAYSAVYEIKPPMDDKGNYILEKDKAYGPEKPSWRYTAENPLDFYSSFVSGAQRMKNGNTFINEGAKGRFFEVTPDGKIVWEYLNQYSGNITKPNGDPDQFPFKYFAFRSNFIPADHPGLIGKKLKPINPQPEPFKLPDQKPAMK